MNDRDNISDKNKMNIVIVGHVDHGKSTIVGRLLADTNTLPDGKLEQIKELCEKTSKPFEYAFLIDALKDEQAQGITIDSARVFFKTKKRNYIIIDAPGHIEFLKNMISGASRAEAALLVIDAKEGVRENSRRHGYMLSMLGIKQISVLVNKMDLVNYDQTVFNKIVDEYTNFLNEINVKPESFIPVSGINGDNITDAVNSMKWYSGKSVLHTLDSFINLEQNVDMPFRMFVQDVYKFTKYGDDRRIVAGTIETGSISVGDKIIFFPSGKTSHVKSIERFNSPKQNTVSSGYAVGITLKEQIFIKRGELAVNAQEQKPETGSRIKVSLFWLGKKPMMLKKEYLLKSGMAKTQIKIESIERIIDASDLSTNKSKKQINRHDVAICTLKLSQAISFDKAANNTKTSRFVIVDDYEISGGGIIHETCKEKETWLRNKVFLRNLKWEISSIPHEKRAEKYNQKATIILITGQKDIGKKRLARALENKLFNDGKIVYFMGIGNLLYGVDADIKDQTNQREEHIRRLSEVSHILLDAGVILIITAIELTEQDLDMIKLSVDPDMIETIWVGKDITTNIIPEIHISSTDSIEESIDLIKVELQNKGIIFKVW